MTDFWDVKKQTEGKNPNQNYDCSRCGLSTEGNHPKLDVYGGGKKRILIIGEFTSYADDLVGKPMTGDLGLHLQNLLKTQDIDYVEDVWRVNALRCRPRDKNGKHKDPTAVQINCCRVKLMETIKRLKPHIIIPITTGTMKPKNTDTPQHVSMQGLFGGKMTGRVEKPNYYDFVQQCIPDQEFGAWIIPMYNPLYYTQLRETQDYDILNCRVVEKVAQKLQQPVPLLDVEEIPVQLLAPHEVQAKIQEFKSSSSWGAFDFETNMIKSQSSRAKLLCTAISNGVETFAFENTEETNKYLREFTADPSIGKVAHNIMFEDSWTLRWTGEKVKNWAWDTNLAAHVQNNKMGTNLKLQTYFNYGVIGYDDEVDKYIKASDDEKNAHGANAVNSMEKCPKEPMMRYCGLDAYFSARLYYTQYSALENSGLLQGYSFLQQATEVLIRLHQNGMRFDKERAYKVDASLGAEIDEIRNYLYKEHPTWKGKTAGKELENYVYNVLGLTSKEGGVSESSLIEMNHPFTDKLLRLKKVEKLKKDTLGGFFREEIDGLLHSTIGVRTATFRTSSSSPNMQNNSKRNKFAKKTIRQTIVPRPGRHYITQVDYSALETYTSSVCYPDPEYLQWSLDANDPTTDTADPHTEWTLYILNDMPIEEWEAFKEVNPTVADNLRTATKTYTFASLYGSTGRAQAERIYEQYLPETKEWIKTRGLNSFAEFERRVSTLDSYIYEELFPVYGKKRRELYNNYLEDTYLDIPTGLKAFGPIRYTQCINIIPQSLGAACKLLALILIQGEIDRRGLKTLIIGEIHDELIFDIPEDELQVMRDVIKWGMVDRLYEIFTWLPMPLGVSWEISEAEEDGGNWSEMKDWEV